ncbi:MAG: anti-sigma factor [Betaproteobacteria bacterium]|nr:anti-sigma factor [Betaproteobacteria bacterium]
MNCRNPQLREQLAAEYVLGTLSGRVRRRFAQLMKYDVELRGTVAAWEMRLTPLAAAMPEISPPARVWQAIAARIGARPIQTGWWAKLGLWRGAAAVSAALVIVLATLLVTRQPEENIALWMLPGGSAAPVSLGVIGTDPTQTIAVTSSAGKMLTTIAAMAISVEPAGGSPTSLPTGPVILSGPWIKVI